MNRLRPDTIETITMFYEKLKCDDVFKKMSFITILSIEGIPQMTLKIMIYVTFLFLFLTI